MSKKTLGAVLIIAGIAVFAYGGYVAITAVFSIAWATVMALFGLLLLGGGIYYWWKRSSTSESDPSHR